MGHVEDARLAAVCGEIPFDGMGQWTVAKSIGLDARLRGIAWLRKSIGTCGFGKNRMSGKKKPQRKETRDAMKNRQGLCPWVKRV